LQTRANIGGCNSFLSGSTVILIDLAVAPTDRLSDLRNTIGGNGFARAEKGVASVFLAVFFALT
jgi:hypothetical protein